MSSDTMDALARAARAVLDSGIQSQDAADALSLFWRAARIGREAGSAPATPAYVENMGKRWEKATPKKKTRTGVTHRRETVPMQQEVKLTSKSRVRVRSRADDHNDVTRLHAEYAKQIAKVVQETENRVRTEEAALRAQMYESLRQGKHTEHRVMEGPRNLRDYFVNNQESSGARTGRYNGTDGNPNGMVSMSYDASFALDLDVVSRSIVLAATVRRVSSYQFSPHQQTYSCVVHIPQERVEDGGDWVEYIMMHMAAQLMSVVDLAFFLHRFVQFLATVALSEDDLGNRNSRRDLSRLGHVTARDLTEARDAVLQRYIPNSNAGERRPFP